jgi:hypothetical protein
VLNRLKKSEKVKKITTIILGDFMFADMSRG